MWNMLKIIFIGAAYYVRYLVRTLWFLWKHSTKNGDATYFAAKDFFEASILKFDCSSNTGLPSRRIHKSTVNQESWFKTLLNFTFFVRSSIFIIKPVSVLHFDMIAQKERANTTHFRIWCFFIQNNHFRLSDLKFFEYGRQLTEC